MAVIAVDWDNVLMNGKEWLPGAQDALKRFREAGHKVVIHSANDPKWIAQNLRNAGIVVDQIWGADLMNVGKPLADIYIDDKGYRFPYNGDWSADLSSVLDLVKDKDNRKWRV